jgi:hypothetical protein
MGWRKAGQEDRGPRRVHRVKNQVLNRLSQEESDLHPCILRLRRPRASRIENLELKV